MYKTPLLCFSVLLFIACLPVDFEDCDHRDVPFVQLEEDSFLFPETGESGEYRFYSNDSEHIKPDGMSFWTMKLGNQSPFSSLDVSLYKVSGNLFAGYGLIFCHGFRGDPSEETMLVLMINLNREYLLGEVIGGSFSLIHPWTFSEYIFPGFNQENRIRITSDLIKGEFYISINGSELLTFTDDILPIHFAGDSGFLSIISPADIFPEKPVEIFYRVH